jgi:hypothetical protein
MNEVPAAIEAGVRRRTKQLCDTDQQSHLVQFSTDVEAGRDCGAQGAQGSAAPISLRPAITPI